MSTNIVGNNIRRMRESRSWTQEELAITSGVDVRTVQRAESGKPLAVDTLRALAAAFDTSIEVLSTPPEQIEKLFEEFNDKYTLLSLDVAAQSSDIATYFTGADAYHFHRHGVLTDIQLDEVADFDSLARATGECWSELDASDRRDEEKRLFAAIQSLAASDVSVSFGVNTVALRRDGLSMDFNTLYVVAVAGKIPLRTIALEKSQLMQFS